MSDTRIITRNLLSDEAINEQGDAYTLTPSDICKTVIVTNAAGKALTIPADEANGPASFPVGARLDVVQGGAGAVTITPDEGVTINQQPGSLATNGQHALVSLLKTGANTWLAYGNLAA